MLVNLARHSAMLSIDLVCGFPCIRVSQIIVYSFVQGNLKKVNESHQLCGEKKRNTFSKCFTTCLLVKSSTEDITLTIACVWLEGLFIPHFLHIAFSITLPAGVRLYQERYSLCTICVCFALSMCYRPKQNLHRFRTIKNDVCSYVTTKLTFKSIIRF